MDVFWHRLKKPFFVLAPMADVTDVVFRSFVAHYGKPDVLYTEFVPCKGLLAPQGRNHLERNLWYCQNERPIVAQVFGSDPDDFFACSKLIREFGFDGMDINMGCPDRKVEKQGAGAHLMRHPKRAQEIIRAAKEGLEGLPLAVKTRIGYNEIETRPWIGSLLEAKPDALIVHGRTRKEMSKVPAHWDEIALAARMARDVGVICVGNGDVESRERGELFARKFGVDGIMIGRGVFGNPWVFGSNQVHDEREKLMAFARFIVQFEGFWGSDKNFNMVKKHIKAYVEGFTGSKSLRVELMKCESEKEMTWILKKFFSEKGWFFPDISYDPIHPHHLFRQKKAFE